MSNILEINSDSSDSENDFDYVPSEDDASELSLDENGSEEEVTVTDTGTVTKKKIRRKRNGRNSSKPESEVVVQSSLNEEEEKKHAQNLWEDFLQDVKPCSPKGKDASSRNVKTDSDVHNQSRPSKYEGVPPKVTISEVYEFAGESVVVTKEVDACSEEAKKQEKITCGSEETEKIGKERSGDDIENARESKRKPLAATKRVSGLSSVIGNLTNKKQKLSTLQKSLIDWKSFTKEEGLEEDLEHHKKSKTSYLENQAFLQRSDLKVFEIEKSIRLNSKTNR